jgi:hypothetical protein
MLRHSCSSPSMVRTHQHATLIAINTHNMVHYAWLPPCPAPGIAACIQHASLLLALMLMLHAH